MKINIMLVEYDSSMVDSITSLFHPDVVEFTVAGDEKAAKALLNKKEFDMVITEALLPKSHGFTLSQYIVENFPKTKVIIISDKSNNSFHKSEAFKCGATELIEKPLNKEKFMDRVLYHLNVGNKEQTGEGRVQDSTNVYVLPFLSELESKELGNSAQGKNLNEIIEELRKKNEPDSFKIDLD